MTTLVSETPAYDAVIVGAGHNGLVAAAYLAKAGLKTAVFERREIVGGACVTEELFPGTKVSVAACWYGMLRPEIVRDLRLAEFGLSTYAMDPQLTAIFPKDRPVSLWLSKTKTALGLLRRKWIFGMRDVRELRRFSRFVDQILPILYPLLTEDPPSLEDVRDSFRKRGLLPEFDQVFEWSVERLVKRFFSDEQMAAMMAASALAISNRGPFEPRTAYHLFHMLLARTSDIDQAWGFARGGMGAVTESLARSAEAFGTKVFRGSPVSCILLKDSEVYGVRLAAGQEVTARVVLSNVDPVATFTRLVPETVLPVEFRAKVSSIKIRGAGGIAHFLVNRLPRFHGMSMGPGVAPEHRGVIMVAPSFDYMDRAWRDAQQGVFPRDPILTIGIQSVTDPTIAPPGKHLVSVFLQFVPYNTPVPGGNTPLPIDIVADALERNAPGFKNSIEGGVYLGPQDLERRFGLTGGHPEHGDMVMEQLFRRRPFLGYDGYRSPIKGLYLCGSGVHPGGTVTGAPGYNAARNVLKDTFGRPGLNEAGDPSEGGR